MATLPTWHSKWTGGKKGTHNYVPEPGTIQAIDAELVKAVKEPLLLKSKGKWSQAGRRYLYDRKNKIYGVVLSTYAERDIHDIFKNQIWQHGAASNGLKSGMTVYVVPSEAVIKTNPNAIGVKFTLA
jgi:hypothetical protein